MVSRFVRSLSLTLLTPISLAAQAVVHTVDDDQPADFATIGDAIAAAAAGDVIAVRDGSYPPFELRGLGVSIVAVEGARVFVDNVGASPMSRIVDLPVGERVVLRGLTLRSVTDDFLGAFLTIDSCRGVVWVEDVVNEYGHALATVMTYDQARAVQVLDCRAAVFVNCSFAGISGFCARPLITAQEFGADAITIRASNVFAHGSEFRGGGSCFQIGAGAHGIEVNGGYLITRDGLAAGGAGATASSTSPAGVGGSGIDIDGGAGVYVIGSQLLGGRPSGLFLPGIPGQPATIGQGSLQQSPAAAARLTTSRLVAIDPSTGGASASLSLTTEALSSTVLIASLGTNLAFAPGVPGFLGAALDAVIVPAGSTDALGRLDIAIAVPALPAGVDVLELAVQFVVLTPVPSLELSNPSAITLVSPF